jgi:hypothetical protein
MRKSSVALGGTLIMALSLCGVAQAQQSTTTAKPPMTGSTKPDTGEPAVEKSMPSSAPAATRKHTTGATNQSKTVKKMNSKAGKEVETGGK